MALCLWLHTAFMSVLHSARTSPSASVSGSPPVPCCSTVPLALQTLHLTIQSCSLSSISSALSPHESSASVWLSAWLSFFGISTQYFFLFSLHYRVTECIDLCVMPLAQWVFWSNQIMLYKCNILNKITVHDCVRTKLLCWERQGSFKTFCLFLSFFQGLFILVRVSVI